MKTFATTIPVWEGDTLQYVTAASEQAAAKRRGEIEFESDPSTAGCFEGGIEISVFEAEGGWEPSSFRKTLAWYSLETGHECKTIR